MRFRWAAPTGDRRPSHVQPPEEIVFEFTQVNVHVHFSSLAIAPVKRPYSALQLDSAVKSMAQALPAVEVARCQR